MLVRGATPHRHQSKFHLATISSNVHGVLPEGLMFFADDPLKLPRTAITTASRARSPIVMVNAIFIQISLPQMRLPFVKSFTDSATLLSCL